MTTLQCPVCALSFPVELGACPRCQPDGARAPLTNLGDETPAEDENEVRVTPRENAAVGDSKGGRRIFFTYLAIAILGLLCAVSVNAGSDSYRDFLVILVLGLVALPTSLLVMPLMSSMGVFAAGVVALLLNVGLAAFFFLTSRGPRK